MSKARKRGEVHEVNSRYYVQAGERPGTFDIYDRDVRPSRVVCKGFGTIAAATKYLDDQAEPTRAIRRFVVSDRNVLGGIKGLVGNEAEV